MSTFNGTASPLPFVRYPESKPRVARGVLLAITLHLLVASSVCLVFYVLHIVSLKALLLQGSVATSGPAAPPEQEIIVQLKLDDIKPPPTDHIEFVEQILKPKPVVVPPPIIQPPPVVVPPPVIVPPPLVVPPPVVPPPVVVPTPVAVPTPAPAVAKPAPAAKPAHAAKPSHTPKHHHPAVAPPAHTAENATGAGASDSVASLVVGSSGFPHPTYPYQALVNRIGGTVLVRVTFDASGGIANAEVAQSSGSTLLDGATRRFIFENWKDATWANRTVEVPIDYTPPQ